MDDKRIITQTEEQDLFFMEKALYQAKIAYANKEIPIGAVIVNSNLEIIGTGYNRVEQYFSQMFHAEVNAINKACNLKKDWRLEDCTIYVTIEPCLMCFGLIGLSRIKRIVYGAQSPLFGCALDKENQPLLYQKHIKGITKNIMADKASDLLKKFFKQKRDKR